MKRWTKILLALAGLVVLVVALTPFLINADTFRPAIEKQLTAALGRSVKFGNLSLAPFSGSLLAKDLSIAEDPSFGSAPFLTASQIRIGVSLAPLIFSHHVDVGTLQIESPQINVIRAANGTWNFSSLAHGALATPAPNGAPSQNSEGSAPALPLSVDRIVIEDGRATVTTLPAHGEPSVYDHVTFTARDFSFTSQFPFELKANLPAGGTISVAGKVGPINRADAATSPADAQISATGLDPVADGFLAPDAGVSLVADVDMHAASDGQTLTTSGTVHLHNLKLRKGAAASPKPVEVAFADAHRLKDSTGQIQDATIKIGDAALHITGTYQPAPGTGDPLLNLKLAGQSLPIDELQSLMTAAAVRLPNGSQLKGGTLSLNLAVSGQAKSLTISGPIALDNTRLVGFDLGSKIHGIAALSGVKTGDTTQFQKLHLNVHITNAGVVADNIDAVIPAMGGLTGSGFVSPANQLNFNLIANVTTAKGIGKFGVSLLSKLSGSGNGSGVPILITGTPDDPYIVADIFNKSSKKK